MNVQTEIERCQTFINCQLQSPHTSTSGGVDRRRWRAVTISRQTGCGAKELGDGIVEYLKNHSDRNAQPWMVFDRNLVEKVLEEHDLPARLAKFMSEDYISVIDDIMEESVGLHPAKWLLVRQTSETILHLATLGNVILIGRGANIVTSALPFVFHVRLIGSLDRRVERLQQERQQGKKAAAKFIRAEDKVRRRYLKKYFGADADDPMHYHMVINTDLATPEIGASMIGNALIENHALT